MSRQTRLRQVFNTTLQIDPGLPDASLRYHDTPGWDSLGAVLLIAAIEDEFGVVIGTAASLSVCTFAAADALLQTLGVPE